MTTKGTGRGDTGQQADRAMNTRPDLPDGSTDKDAQPREGTDANAPQADRARTSRNTPESGPAETPGLRGKGPGMDGSRPAEEGGRVDEITES